MNTQIHNSEILRGNLVGDIVIRQTRSAIPLALATVAVDDEGPESKTKFVTIELWRSLAANAAKSLRKGDPVVVIGQMVERTWHDKNNVEQHQMRLNAELIAPDLKLIEWPARNPQPTAIRHQTVNGPTFLEPTPANGPRL